jgi:hypothetical protein
MNSKDRDDFSLSVPSHSNYILIDVKRPMTIDLARQCGEGIAALGQEKNINRFLFDLRSAPSLTNPAHDYNFAHYDMKDLNMPRNHRAALLVDPEDKSHDLFETVMVNAGYSTRLFQDKCTAITWLVH